MLLTPIETQLRDGRTVQIRAATSDDVPAIFRFSVALIATTDQILSQPGEEGSLDESAERFK